MKRYDFSADMETDCYEATYAVLSVDENKYGEYVTYETAAKLAEQVEQLKAENRCLLEAIDPARMDEQVNWMRKVLDKNENLAKVCELWKKASQYENGYHFNGVDWSEDCDYYEAKKRKKQALKMRQQAAKLYKEAMEE